MKVHKLTGAINYTDARDNPKAATFNYELQCSSNREEQRKLITDRWLQTDAPALTTSSDIASVDFRAVALSDDEMSDKYGAVQGSLI